MSLVTAAGSAATAAADPLDVDRSCVAGRACGDEAGDQLADLGGAALGTDAVLVAQEALAERLEPVLTRVADQIVGRHGFYASPSFCSSIAFGMAPTACLARMPFSNSPTNGMPVMP